MLNINDLTAKPNQDITHFLEQSCPLLLSSHLHKGVTNVKMKNYSIPDY